MTDTPDLSEFYSAVRRVGPICTIRKLLGRLPPDRAASLQAALAAPRDDIPHTAVSAVVKGWGESLSEFTVSRHRMGQCSCPRT